VTLTWSAPAGSDPVDSYVIEAGSAPGIANLANFATGNAATSFSAGGVPDGSYYVRVRARNSSGTSAASNEAPLVVSGGGGGCATAPGAPSGLTVIANTAGTVVLTWTAAAGAPTTYIVEAGSASGLSNLANSDLGGAGTTLTATGVGAGTYYVRIRARNACGTGPASNEVVLTVGTTPVTLGDLSGAWHGTVTSSRCSGGPPCPANPVTVNFTQTGNQLIGTIPGLTGAFDLTQSAEAAGTRTFSGNFTTTGGRCNPVIFAGSMVVTGTTMTGSFSGTNSDCLSETNTFSLQKR
jgi:hypothetical protein